MGKEFVVSSNRHETKVAVLEDDQLVEVYFQRSNEYSLAGSIHKGRVTRVLPGMQSAFVDIGLERDAFLYVSDFFEEHEEYDKIAVPAEDRGRGVEKANTPPPAVAAVAAAPGTERPPEAESRDRKNRRSRRRRNRERSFPESKYVSAAPSPTPSLTPVPEPMAEAMAEPAPETEADFPMLPGESLAKYRPAVVDEPEALEDAPADVVLPEAASEVVEQPVAIEEVPEPEDQAEWEPAVLVEEPEPPEEIAVAEAMEALEAGSSPVVEEPPEMPSTAEEPEPAAGLTAEVREPAQRYPHRVSRRLRRKQRGPAAGETREHHQPADVTARKEPVEAPSATAGISAPSISDLLKEGQEVLVQISKEPLGQKGARITSHIALPGRYVVYMPTVDHMGVSRKVASDEERLRLRRILQAHGAGLPGGFIVRTAGEGKSERDIAADMMFLYDLWLDIRQKAEKRPAPAHVHHDLDIVQRLLRDQLADNFKAIWVDNEEVYESVLRFVERLQPAMVPRIKMYTREAPIFDAFSVTAELEKALRPKVWLKSGGYIVVNQTEALVAIDVNTGKFVGKSNRLEDTIVKTNTEAIREIVRQIRLRDLGGIIVVDFIDMDERKNRQKVMQVLEDEMRRDRAPNKILQFNDFGLVAITRKRVKQSLERTLCAPCPYCEGAGYVKSVQTVISEILQEAHKIAKAVEGPNVVLRASSEVAKVLKSTDNDYLEELEGILRRPVLVSGDPQLHPEKWDLA
jgi:ribonuclease G